MAFLVLYQTPIKIAFVPWTLQPTRRMQEMQEALAISEVLVDKMTQPLQLNLQERAEGEEENRDVASWNWNRRKKLRTQNREEPFKTLTVVPRHLMKERV